MRTGASSRPKTASFLIVKLDRTFCAIPLSSVVEIMRPQPIEPIAGLPRAILGASRIRGVPVPVLDLATVIKGETSGNQQRFVTLRVQDRIIALAVNSVVGVLPLDNSGAGRLPPLLHSANSDVIQAITERDSELLLVLSTAHLLSPQELEMLSRERMAS